MWKRICGKGSVEISYDTGSIGIYELTNLVDLWLWFMNFLVVFERFMGSSKFLDTAFYIIYSGFSDFISLNGWIVFEIYCYLFSLLSYQSRLHILFKLKMKESKATTSRLLYKKAVLKLFTKIFKKVYSEITS